MYMLIQHVHESRSQVVSLATERVTTKPTIVARMIPSTKRTHLKKKSICICIMGIIIAEGWMLGLSDFCLTDKHVQRNFIMFKGIF